MENKPRILIISESGDRVSRIPPSILEAYDFVEVSNPLRALALAEREQFEGVFVAGGHVSAALRLGRLFQNDRILESMPDGVAVLDVDNVIVWTNECLRRWVNHGNIVGEGFYAALGGPEIVRPEYCPFHTAMSTGRACAAILKVGGDRFLHIHAAPLADTVAAARHLIVTVRDVTAEILQQQKMAAIHKAGEELAGLTTEEVYHMAVEDRIELLKSNIIHFTKDLLKFDVVEIRLVEKDGRLTPLLSMGLDPEGRDRVLYAKPEGNGVTGFVAATGKSYLCEDTAEDPLFLEGFAGSRSSLTVPLLLHDQVIGTFNVESPKKNAFSEADTQFLEIFSRDVAYALNTLQLLVAQKANAALESIEAIHREVALPVDEILNDAVHIMERYIGHEPEVVDRVQRVLSNARDIARVIQQVGRRMTPADAVPVGSQVAERPKLREKRVLVVDAEETVRKAAHELLEKYGCIVETAHDGEEAVVMVRNSMRGIPYDVIISDIRLPDMSGHGLMTRLKEIMEPLPLILMQGFGYDPGHAIVKARIAGLHPKALLFKPFRLDQLLSVVETILDEPQGVPQQQ